MIVLILLECFWVSAATWSSKRFPRLPELFGTGQHGQHGQHLLFSTRQQQAAHQPSAKSLGSTALRGLLFWDGTMSARFKQKSAEKLGTKMGTRITETLCVSPIAADFPGIFFEFPSVDWMRVVTLWGLARRGSDNSSVSGAGLRYVQISFNFQSLFDHCGNIEKSRWHTLVYRYIKVLQVSQTKTFECNSRLSRDIRKTSPTWAEVANPLSMLHHVTPLQDIWRFPARHRGTPSHHPYLSIFSWDFPWLSMKSSSWGFSRRTSENAPPLEDRQRSKGSQVTAMAGQGIPRCHAAEKGTVVVVVVVFSEFSMIHEDQFEIDVLS